MSGKRRRILWAVMGSARLVAVVADILRGRGGEGRGGEGGSDFMC
jgi:hypothetical protein